MTIEAPSAPGKLDAVQLLRAVAATMVVLGHIIGIARHQPGRFGTVPELRFAGGAGVDVFFLISGFIMVYASRRMFGSAKGAQDFLLRRLVRIVPLYWAVTALTLLLAIIGHDTLPSVAGIAASFAFLPFDTYGEHNGFAFPLVNLGWTLNYEMMFYVVFALCMPLGRNRGVVAVTVAMVAIVLFGQIVEPSEVALRFWTQPIILEFAAGALIALAATHDLIRLPVWGRVTLIVLAVALYLLDPIHMIHRPAIGPLHEVISPNGFERVLGWGVPSALLMIATVAGSTSLGSWPARAVVSLGDASYALYLLHPFAIAVMLRVAMLPLARSVGGATLFVLATFLLAAVGSIIFHKLIERPLTTFLTRRLQRSGAPILGVPLTPDASRKPPAGI